ncbi:acetylglucosaminylphosphatidylinositol deacetylase [Bordetella genomosp. 5]|uniref:GlcNAc-PI de-N-acetylase n=1 Tax=Bordetella genomosp. 5 TaxID=1395608 RepID=A0A261TSY4_9BORD|nr:acetylglucosaminylphosphatidylinositol deacetylase [Bordetella genomosp. 5]OZI52262.1 hypothetical protein CAL25_11165 [Bordetella genomosp. 5]
MLAGSDTLHVLAPHPDDEVLACAGLMRRAVRLGVAVRVWAVTDGEASHPGSTQWPSERLRQARADESSAALATLGVFASRVRLAIPDGGVSAREKALAEALARVVDRGDTLVAPWRLDGHPDHEAVGRAAAEVAARRECRLLEAPIWGWHWADPADEPLPRDRAVCVPLDPADRHAKARAMRCYTSQLAADASTGRPPILPPFALARFHRPFEVFLR